MSEQELRAHIPEYLHLDIGQRLQGDDEFKRVIPGEDEFSIIRGWYVSLCAQSSLESNSVDGLMLDMEGHPQVRDDDHHGGLSKCAGFLEICIRASETVELCEQHFGAFNHLFGINLGHSIIESDQGPALCSLCASKEQVQLFCLHHFLLSLKQKDFSCQAGNLVKCRTEDEFESLRRMYEVEFQMVTEPNRCKPLN
jgi:hypothetical protein